MANFSIAIKRVLKIEGEFVNSPYDNGGKTKYGITEYIARAYNYTGKMKDLPIETALEIYKKKYWDVASLDFVNDQEIAYEIFDTSVNCGVVSSIKYLQRALNVLNREGKDWDDLSVDGVMGPVTIQTLNNASQNYLKKRNILKVQNILQGFHYITLAEKPERRDEMNINGWINQRIEIIN